MTSRNLLDELLEIDPTAIPTIQANTGNIVVVPASTLPVVRKKETRAVEAILVPDAHPLTTQDDDMAFARKKMRNIIKVAEDAYTDLAVIANETEQPRAYEVLANLLKTASEVTKELVGTHKIKEEINRLKNAPRGMSTAFDNDGAPSGNNNLTQINQTIEQAVFVGSATDMLDRIDRKRSSEIKIVESTATEVIEEKDGTIS